MLTHLGVSLLSRICYDEYMNREPFSNDEYYHIYNRGVDKRQIFMDNYDVNRFLKGMELFNSVEPIGSLYVLSFMEESHRNKKFKKLVDIVAYCLNNNHYHFILKQCVDRGISEFMRRVNGGYTLYFNNKIKRSGSLFQGMFKSKYIDGNDYLLRLSSYVNLNDRVHQLRGETAKLSRSSWDEYVRGIKYLCNVEVVLKQFKNRKDYEQFALDTLPQITKRKEDEKELAKILME